jgi:hypothetical protein
MPNGFKKGRLSFIGDQPMELVEDAGADAIAPTQDQRETFRLIGRTVRAYVDAARGLLAGKYRHLRKFAPEYLTDPGNAMVITCAGGTVIRYEKKQETSKVFAGWMGEDLRQVVALLSQNLIQCHPDRDFSSTAATTGTEIKLFSVNPGTNETTEHLFFRIGFDVVVSLPEQLPIPPRKPFCLSSVRNTLVFQLLGELVGEGEEFGQGQRFLSRTRLRLPVGWECIEIFPFTNFDHWKPEYASGWAENDILAAVAACQLHESYFQSLDPQAAARKEYANLLKDFKALLDSSPQREETFQSFLRDHPVLLCPTKTKMWSKLPFGSKVSDFVFRDATLDYLLVELEKSTHALFRDDGHPKRELNVAIGQITDWKRYLEDNLRTVQDELGLSGISANPRSLVVIGRSSTLSSENRRKLKTMENEQPRLRIMTYDDVYENAKAVIENLLGPIWDAPGQTQIYYVNKT